MAPRISSPIIGAALLAGCKHKAPTVEPPSQPALEACEGQDMGSEDFDWSCCSVWYDECMAEGGDTSDCMWICNG